MDILEQNHEIIDINTTYGMLFDRITEGADLVQKVKPDLLPWRFFRIGCNLQSSG